MAGVVAAGARRRGGTLFSCGAGAAARRRGGACRLSSAAAAAEVDVPEEAREAFVPLVGGSVWYRDTGRLQAAPFRQSTVLCVSSVGHSAPGEFRRLTPLLLDRGFRVLEADVRLSGRSDDTFSSCSTADMAEDCEAVADHAGADRVLLVAAGTSAGVALRMAAERPERVEGLILLSPLLRDTPRVRMARQLLVPLLRPPWGAAVFAWAHAAAQARRPVDLDAYCREVRRNLDAPARLRAAREVFGRSLGGEGGEDLARLKVPTHVLVGGADPLTGGRPEGEWVFSRVPGRVWTKLEVLDGVGAAPHAELANEVAMCALELRDVAAE